MSPTLISVASGGLKDHLEPSAPKVHQSLLTMRCPHPLLQDQLRRSQTISSLVILIMSTLQPNNLFFHTLDVEPYLVLP